MVASRRCARACRRQLGGVPVRPVQGGWPDRPKRRESTPGVSRRLTIWGGTIASISGPSTPARSTATAPPSSSSSSPRRARPWRWPGADTSRSRRSGTWPRAASATAPARCRARRGTCGRSSSMAPGIATRTARSSRAPSSASCPPFALAGADPAAHADADTAGASVPAGSRRPATAGARTRRAPGGPTLTPPATSTLDPRRRRARMPSPAGQRSSPCVVIVAGRSARRRLRARQRAGRATAIDGPRPTPSTAPRRVAIAGRPRHRLPSPS